MCAKVKYCRVSEEAGINIINSFDIKHVSTLFQNDCSNMQNIFSTFSQLSSQ